MAEDQIKKLVREGYGFVATSGRSCFSGPILCCGKSPIEKSPYYRDTELHTIPEGANLGLSCGNPTSFLEFQEGDTVIDLGSGAGIDSFLAARKVKETGCVIGVDMTPEMIKRAQENKRLGQFKNVYFILGDIEDLPLNSSIADHVISNCVINLASDKKRVFKEIFRVLKRGGRMTISDIVVSKELPPWIKDSQLAYVGCISGALQFKDYMEIIREVGFEGIEVIDETEFSAHFLLSDPAIKKALEELNISLERVDLDIAISITVTAEKRRTP